MERPSIEASLSRKLPSGSMRPLMKRLERMPVLGTMLRAPRDEGPRGLWASLPPVAA